MKLKIFLLLFITVLYGSSYSAGIATGGKKFNYYAIGNDIKNVCKKVNLKVYPTDGSLNNYELLFKNNNIQFGIMQYDVLNYLKQANNVHYKQVKIVYPLYTEALHIFVRKDLYIKKLSDLNGKKVGIGKENSGQWVTAQYLIKKGNLKWNVVTDNTITALLTGKVDAVIKVTAAPWKAIKDMKGLGEFIKLASLNDPLLDKLYTKIVIPSNSYEFQPKKVYTYGIMSVLVSNSKNKGLVTSLYQCIDKNLYKLRRSGNPKWREIRFTNIYKIKWPVYSSILNLYNQKIRKKYRKTRVSSNSGILLPKMVRIPSGSYMMGSNNGDSDEKPVHRERIENPFYISKYEVTNKQYVEFLNSVGNVNDDWFDTKKRDSDSHIIYKNGRYEVENGYEYKPVIEVSWYGAKAYTKWLSKKTGKVYRLPSEAEWEYVARTGKDGVKWSFGNDKSMLGEYAWYTKNSDGHTHIVGSKKPNRWGVYDMAGNVWEMMEDSYVNNYNYTPRDGKPYISDDTSKIVCRGGSYASSVSYTRAPNRAYNYTKSDTDSITGFRVVREIR